MTDNIKKAADRAEWWKLIDAACEPYGGFVHVINSCGGSTVSMIWIETLKAAFTSEAGREYWEQESWMTGFPEKTGHYIVYDTNCIPGWEIKTARFDSYNNQWFELSGDAIHPSQWRPLPKPPKTV